MKKSLAKLADWRHWPFLPFHFPLFFVWGFYIFKHRAIWFFTPANPTLTFAGFEGETKKEMYGLLPDYAYPKTIYINPDVPFEVVSGMVSANHFSFPLIVKPDIGMAGILFRKIETGNQLARYHDKINTNYLIQEFVEMPLELGIFYIRLPDANKGKITALFCKKFPVIQGDGISSLEQLLQKNQIPVTDETVKLSREKLQQILPENETFHLSFVGNRYHGASFHDLSDEIDESLLDVVDKLSQQANFFYGRYDIKCASIDDLKKGKNFTVLEFNGAGSIVNHVYTDRFTLRSAYREICNHWKALSAISVANHKKGIPYWSAVKGYKYLRRAKKNLHMQKKLDKEIILSNEATTFNL